MYLRPRKRYPFQNIVVFVLIQGNGSLDFNVIKDLMLSLMAPSGLILSLALLVYIFGFGLPVFFCCISFFIIICLS